MTRAEIILLFSLMAALIIFEHAISSQQARNAGLGQAHYDGVTCPKY